MARVAELESKSADKIQGARIGTCILYHKSFYTGFNKKVTHPIQQVYGEHSEKIYLHSEVDALIRAKFRGEIIVSVRTRADNSWGIAKPCKGCIRALGKFKEIWYSTGKGRELARL